ncbi:MAG: hypothetical protein I3273_05775 [Candidatus Moeniiplasma glomeromycotorum]|nr:hypothetical protein [Candidatus Moeniiplasma glomeromycotorum]MCE8169594.1 hypothetical protein [Candidatus Moeniiplasma glomeromycotorum]
MNQNIYQCSQCKNNSTNENSAKHKVVIYTVVGIAVLCLIGIIFMMVKTKKENSKTKL